MPQELCVLRCYVCNTFQVHQVKKSNKWECKMCGKKQSMKKMYGRGTGPQCRLLVQSLNMSQGKVSQEIVPFNTDHDESTSLEGNSSTSKTQFMLQSKWNSFLAVSDQASTPDDPTNDEDTKYTTDVAVFNKHKKLNNKRKKTGKSDSYQENKYAKFDDDFGSQRETNLAARYKMDQNVETREGQNLNLNKTEDFDAYRIQTNKMNSRWSKFANEDDCDENVYSRKDSSDYFEYTSGTLFNNSSKWNKFVATPVEKSCIARDKHLTCIASSDNLGKSENSSATVLPHAVAERTIQEHKQRNINENALEDDNLQCSKEKTNSFGSKWGKYISILENNCIVDPEDSEPQRYNFDRKYTDSIEEKENNCEKVDKQVELRNSKNPVADNCPDFSIDADLNDLLEDF